MSDEQVAELSPEQAEFARDSWEIILADRREGKKHTGQISLTGIKGSKVHAISAVIATGEGICPVRTYNVYKGIEDGAGLISVSFQWD